MAITTQEARRGYLRTRREPVEENIAFLLQGYRFETDWRDLWVTPPDTDRLDRFKVTRGPVSRSAQRGYPAELFRADSHLAEPQAQAIARFWLDWKDTGDAAAHRPVRLDHHRRSIERGTVLQEAR